MFRNTLPHLQSSLYLTFFRAFKFNLIIDTQRRGNNKKIQEYTNILFQQLVEYESKTFTVQEITSPLKNKILQKRN